MSKGKFAIYCDFDGTITTEDTIDFLLEHLATPEWKEIEVLWEDGVIGSRECLSRQIPLIQGGWDAVENLLPQIKIDSTFKAFADWCKQKDIPLFVVSEGVTEIIRLLLTREGIDIPIIRGNSLNENSEGRLTLSFPYTSPDPNCMSGLCKCQMLETLIDAPDQKPLRIVIGDGYSDRCWAQNADLVFAKKKLQQYCETENIPHIAFQHFDEIRHTLESKLRLVSQNTSCKDSSPIDSVLKNLLLKNLA